MALSAGFLPQRVLAQNNVNDEIRDWAAHAPLSMKFRGGSISECRTWQREFAAKLSELLGPAKPPERWQEIRERIVDLEDHQREELLLRADGHRDLPVYRLTPRGPSAGKRPGILALHGHGDYGYDPVAGIGTTPESAARASRLCGDSPLLYAVRPPRR
jgi:hypothetical protein